jgi:hypothetical protein
VSIAGLVNTKGYSQANDRNADQEHWAEALQKLRAERRLPGKVSNLGDDEAAALLQSLRANAHHTANVASGVFAPAHTLAGPTGRGAQSEKDDGLTQDIVADLQRHNEKLRAELRNVITDAEHMLQASSSGCKYFQHASSNMSVFLCAMIFVALSLSIAYFYSHAKGGAFARSAPYACVERTGLQNQNYSY